ncbi:MAG: hypothetical protein AAF380_03295 [Bacteroidota bacterium]
MKKPHGNSKLCKKKQHLYVILDKNGKVMEYGISGQKLNKDGTSPRGKHKLRTKPPYKDNPEAYTVRVLKTDINGRAEALKIEKDHVTTYAKNNNNKKPRHQKRPNPDI